MTSVEKRNLKTRPKIGDIVEITWLDHFRFSGDAPPSKAVVVKSWGKLVQETEEGVSIAQNEVQSFQPEFPVTSIEEGQFNVRGSIAEIKRIKTAKT